MGDFFAQDGAETVAQAMQRDAKRRLGDAKPDGEFGVRGLGAAAAREGGQEQIKGGRAFRRLLGPNAVRDGLQKRERPGAIKGPVGRGFGSRGEHGVIERGLEPDIAARRAGVVAEIGKVVVEGREQPGAETDGARTKRGEGFEAEEAGEEALHRVVRVRLGKPAPQRVAEERRPVGGAEIGQGAGGDRVCVRPRVPPGVEDERPTGGGEGGGQKMISGTKIVSWSCSSGALSPSEIILATSKT